MGSSLEEKKDACPLHSWQPADVIVGREEGPFLLFINTKSEQPRPWEHSSKAVPALCGGGVISGPVIRTWSVSCLRLSAAPILFKGANKFVSCEETFACSVPPMPWSFLCLSSSAALMPWDCSWGAPRHQVCGRPEEVEELFARVSSPLQRLMAASSSPPSGRMCYR